MANLGRQQLSSRQAANRKQNKNLFEPRKFSAPNRDINSPSATTDLTDYRQPQSGEIIANVRRTLEAGTAQTPAFNLQRSNELTAPRQDNSGTIPIIQPKLTIGRPDDKYEREADRVASQVVQQINTPPSTQSPQESVQRSPGKTLQTKQNTSLVQRSSLVPGLQREAIAGGEASTELTSAINTARGGGQPLDAGLQKSIGQAMGADFSRVRVHTDARSDQLNQSIQAKAFTTGQDVFFRQGAYQPGSRGGQQLIAHELTHVVQQKETRREQEVVRREIEINSQKYSFSNISDINGNPFLILKNENIKEQKKYKMALRQDKIDLEEVQDFSIKYDEKDEKKYFHNLALHRSQILKIGEKQRLYAPFKSWIFNYDTPSEVSVFNVEAGYEKGQKGLSYRDLQKNLSEQIIKILDDKKFKPENANDEFWKLKLQSNYQEIFSVIIGEQYRTNMSKTHFEDKWNVFINELVNLTEVKDKKRRKKEIDKLANIPTNNLDFAGKDGKKRARKKWVKDNDKYESFVKREIPGVAPASPLRENDNNLFTAGYFKLKEEKNPETRKTKRRKTKK